MSNWPKINLAFNGRCLEGPTLGGWSRYTESLLEHLQTDYADQLNIFIFKNEAKQNQTLWEQRELPRLCEQNNIAILHAPANGGLPVAGNFKKLLTVHDLFSEEDFRWQQILSNMKAAVRYKLDWWLSLRAADAILTVSEFSKAQLQAYGIQKPLFLTYEGVDLPANTLNSPLPGESYLIYVGSFDQRKRTDHLIESFLKTQNNLKLVLIGKGALEQKKKFPSSRLRFLENLSDSALSQYYSHATAFVTFSRSEGFGLPLAEALNFCCPVLYNGDGAIPEIVSDGGLRIQSEALDQTLKRLIEDRSSLDHLRLKAQKQGLKFSWKKTAEETFQIYQSLVNAKVKS